jgi:hypothetical protein
MLLQKLAMDHSDLEWRNDQDQITAYFGNVYSCGGLPSEQELWELAWDLSEAIKACDKLSLDLFGTILNDFNVDNLKLPVLDGDLILKEVAVRDGRLTWRYIWCLLNANTANREYVITVSRDACQYCFTDSRMYFCR